MALGAMALIVSCTPKEQEDVLVSISASSASFADGKFNLDLALSGKASTDVAVELASAGSIPAEALSFDKSVSIPAGSLSAKVPVTLDVTGLTPGTYDATFTIASATGAKVDASKGSCKISFEIKGAEEARPVVSISEYSDAFADGKASLTLALDKAAAADVEVTFEVKTESDGFVAIPAEALTFSNPAKIPAGQLKQTVDITLDIDAIPGGAVCYAVIAIASVSDNAQIAASKTRTYIEASKEMVAIERADWTVTYDGEVEIEGDTADAISVSGLGDGSYYIYIYQKGTVKKYFPEGMQSYLEYMEEDLVEVLGTDKAPQIKQGDKTWYYNVLPVGAYEVWVLGCTAGGHLTGEYASLEIVKEATPEILEAYGKWLGEWKTTRGKLTDDWVISENVPGASFYIQGIDGDNSTINDILVEADYDAANDAIVLYTQDDCKEVKYDGKTYTIALVGLITYSGNLSPVSGEYDIAVISMKDENTATIKSAGSIQLTDGNSYEVSGMCFFASTPGENSGYIYNGQTFYNWPETMSRVVANENDPNYNAMLGNWTITRMDSEWDSDAKEFVDLGEVTDTWTFSPKVAGYSYSISGIEGFEDVAIVAKFDSKTKSFTIKEQELVIEDHILHLCGLFDYQNEEYLWDGGLAICTGKMDSRGTNIKLSPSEISSTYGSFHGMQLFEYVYDEEEDDDHYYPFHNEGYKIPATLAKGSAQSAPANVIKSRPASMDAPAFGTRFRLSRKAASVSFDKVSKSL